MDESSTASDATARDDTLDSDIIIIGAGPAGLSLALSLRGAGLSVTLLEKQPSDAIENPRFDGREIALSLRSIELLKAMGAWERIPAQDRSLLRSAKVINGRSDACLHFDADAVGADKLGVLVANHAIRKSLFDEHAARGEAELITDANVTDIRTGSGGSSVTLSDGRRLHAKLLVAADTRFSQARRSAGISASMHDFGKTMIVSRVKLERPHDHIAWECFLEGGAIAVLPLNDNQASIVATFTPEEASRHMAMDPDAYAAEAAMRLGQRFGALTPTSDRNAYPLVGVYANRFTSPGFALAGDAAVGMHPVTAHGFNLGVQGQDLLATEIRKAVRAGHGPACGAALAAYHRKHRRLSHALYWSTVAVAELYARETPLALLTRRVLLDAGRLLPPARQVIMSRLTQSGARRSGGRFTPSAVGGALRRSITNAVQLPF